MKDGGRGEGGKGWGGEGSRGRKEGDRVEVRGNERGRRGKQRSIHNKSKNEEWQ